MAGKSTGKKSRLSGRRGPADDRDAKRHKAYGIKQFLQPAPRPQAHAEDLRDSSEEPDDQLPSQTPAVALLPAAASAAGPQFTAPTAVGAKLQTALLRSLQHRFATQQALETPAGAAAGGGGQLQPQPQPGLPQQQQQQQQQQLATTLEEDEEDEEEGFQIFSQLAYEPTFLSQRPPDLADEPAQDPPDASQQHTLTQLPPGSQQGAAPAAEPEGDDDLDWPSSQLLSQHQQQEDALRRASGTAAEPKTTPALQSVERVQCDAGARSGQKMFPLFRRRDTLKKLYIVRHGESTYNAAMQARGSGWADPRIFDAALTERGRQQARALRQQLAALDLPPDTLWVTSPLQRAVQTLLLACPTAHLLGGPGGAAARSPPAGAENSSAAPNGGAPGPPSVAVLHAITEKVFTCGDIGHPASELRKRFPQLERQLGALPELWWHSPADRPNCALQELFGSNEGKEQVLSRVGAFRRWLQERPERVIVAVGHSSYWRSFEEVCRGTKPSHMRNCEVRLVHL